MTDQQYMHLTGDILYVLLILILLARPVHKYLKFKYLMKYRRQLGWLVGITCLFHFGYWFLYYFTTQVLMNSLVSWWFWYGVLSIISCFGLAAISNNWSVKKLGGKRWKTIQKYGLYLIIPTALLHGQFATRGFDPSILLWASPMILLLGWRFGKHMMTWSALASLIMIQQYTYYSTVSWSPEQTDSVQIEVTEDETIYDIEVNDEFVCPRITAESFSCGYPIYLSDGTRIDGYLRGWERSHTGSYRKVEP